MGARTVGGSKASVVVSIAEKPGKVQQLVRRFHPYMAWSGLRYWEGSHLNPAAD